MPPSPKRSPALESFYRTSRSPTKAGLVELSRSNGAHVSRLREFKTATYYLTVLLLQFIPFSLSIGAGIRCGVDLYAHNAHASWRFWQYRIPRQDLLDLGYVYCVSLPLFLMASGFEFLSTWNV